MNMNKFVQNNKVSLSIIVFIAVLSVVHFIIKPNIIYNKDGSYKQFGLGYRNKTVVPIWLVSIILAIFSYVFVCWLNNEAL